MDTILTFGFMSLFLVVPLAVLWFFYRVVRVTYAGLRYFAAINGWYGGALSNEECREAYDRWNIEPHPDLGYWIVFVALMALAAWFIWFVVTSPPPGF